MPMKPKQRKEILTSDKLSYQQLIFSVEKPRSSTTHNKSHPTETTHLNGGPSTSSAGSLPNWATQLNYL